MGERNHSAGIPTAARIGLVVFATAVGLLLTLAATAAAGAPFGPSDGEGPPLSPAADPYDIYLPIVAAAHSLLEQERFGVGLAASANAILQYDLEALGASWYLNWWVASDPPEPNGAWYMQNIRLDQGVPRISTESLRSLVRANPGAIWEIGNEPDSIYLDNSTPQQYAEAYYQLYPIIKDEDPTAQVAAGGIVQATPLRMLYLQRAWEAYQQLSGGEDMPVDVWIVHGFVLNETYHQWGAEIPPGMGDRRDLAAHRYIRDVDSMALFEEQIVRFRQWMADHGQRNKPLLVNEYGILMWSDIMDEDGEDFSDDRVIDFMYATFDYFLTATDPDLGYPADGNRLVQAWAWYSLDDNTYQDGEIYNEGYNGDLFTGQVTKTITALGQAYGDYVHGDLQIGSLLFAPTVPLLDSPVVTVTATAVVTKAGKLDAPPGTQVSLWLADPAQGDPAVTWTLGLLPAGQGLDITAELPLTASGLYTVTVVVDPADECIETDETNNGTSRSLLVASTRSWLPLILRTAW